MTNQQVTLSPSLATLGDVDLSNLANNDLLVYSLSQEKWINSPTVPVSAGVDSVNGVDGKVVLTSVDTSGATGGAAITITPTGQNVDLELAEITSSSATLFGKGFDQTASTAPTSGQALSYNGTVWAPGTVVTSVSNSDGTLTVSPTSGAVVASLNLAHANTWSSLQTFGTDISFLGAQVSGSIASGNLLYYNGTNWIGQSLASGGTGISVSGTTITNTGVISLTAGDGISVSTSTGAVTVSALLNGTTLLNGSSGLSLNLASANTWTATVGTTVQFIAYAGSAFQSSAFLFEAFNGPSVVLSTSGGRLHLGDGTFSGVSTFGGVILDDGSGDMTVNGNFTTYGNATVGLSTGSQVLLNPDITMNSAPATSTTTEVNSGDLNVLGAYWDGSVSKSFGYTFYSQTTGSGSTPSATLTVAANSNGTLSTLLTMDGAGDLTFAGYGHVLSSTARGTGQNILETFNGPSIALSTDGFGRLRLGDSTFAGVSTVGGIVLDDGSGDMTVNGNLTDEGTFTVGFTTGAYTTISGENVQQISAAATSSTTVVNSGYRDLLGSYWNGSAAVPVGFRTSSVVSTTTPLVYWLLEYYDNGTLTQAGYLDNIGTTGLGHDALAANTGSYNSAFGFQALSANTTGLENAAFGYQALAVNTTGSYNSAFGYTALYHNTTGSNNSAFGQNALFENTSGEQNSAVGYQALFYNTTGYFNSAVGYATLYSNTVGHSNTGVGHHAMANNTAGNYNSAFGQRSLYNFNNTTGANSTLLGIGYAAGYNYTGNEINNIVIGYNEGVAGESSMLRIGQPNASTPTGQIAFSMLGLSGLGLAPIYGAGLLISLGTTSTTVATYTPTSSTGQSFEIKWRLSCVTASTPTLTLTYTDPKAGAQTITLYNTAMTADSVASGSYPLVATSAAAITVAGLDSVAAGDIYATAEILQYQ